jgi:hypothetical protein
MTIDTKKLRELAEAATPGPWVEIERCDNASADEACGVTSKQRTKYGHIVGIFQSDARDECSHPVSKANAAFIAAANPQTVIALLDEVESLRDVKNHDAHARCGWNPEDGDGVMVAKKILTSGRMTGEDVGRICRAHLELREQLTAMTKARDEACDIAMKLRVVDFGDRQYTRHVKPTPEDQQRIATLRLVGTTKEGV